MQALYDETAVASGEVAATVLLDLAKAFESVPLELVWERGKDRGFPLGVLRLSLEVCAFVRHLTLAGATADGVSTLSAILAGTSFATDLLYAVLIVPCDNLLLRWPRLNLSLVVDDLAVQAVGTEEDVPGTITGAIRQVVGELTAAGCMVSKGGAWAPGGKTVATGTSARLRRRLLAPFRAQGVKVSRHARHLGVDYTPGARGPRLRTVAAKRLVDAKTRKERLTRLGLPKKAVNRILRTAVLPSAVHGAEVTGVTDQQLRIITSLSHQAFGNATGRSAYARLYLCGGTPGAREAVAPIFKWATAYFDSEVPRGILEIGWRRAIRDVGQAARPQQAVSGPAGAAVAAAARLGWTMTGPGAFREANGNVLELSREAPLTVRKAALEAFEVWAANRSSLEEQVGGTPFLEPLRGICSSKKTSPAASGSLRAMAEGAWPTQASLYEAGLSDSPICQACEQDKGTFYHRVRMCRCTRDLRQGQLGSAMGMIGEGSPEEEASNPLFRRGLPIAPERKPPPTFYEEWVEGDAFSEQDDYAFTGTAGSDGSLIDLRPIQARRAGWSAVSTSHSGELRFACYGTCPDRCPTAHRAELWGILMVVSRAVFPLRLLTDHQRAVKAWERGRAYCCDSARPAADLWRDIWAILDQHPGEFKLEWVRGHTTDLDVLRGRIDPAAHKINVLADKYAGLGAEAAKAQVPNAEDIEAFDRATAFYRMCVRLCSDWPTDYVQDRQKQVKDRSVKPAGQAVHPQRPHEPWRCLDGRGACALCRQKTTSKSLAAFATFCRSPCRAVGPSGGPKGAAFLCMVEAERAMLTGRGALKVPTRMPKAQPAPAALDPDTAVTTIPVVALTDRRATTMKPLTNGMVSLDARSGI